MLFKRQGYPEEGELVICTVTSVKYNSVFVKLDDYDKQGLIHISEVSPGRIRNIRDFVEEGKLVVCKVLRVDESKGYIDLSLRRVSESQKRKATDERKQEQKAEKIIDALAKELQKPLAEVYKEVADKLLKEYYMLHQAFQEVVEKNISLEKLGLEKKLAEKLTSIVNERIKPKEVMIKARMRITIYADNGVEIIRSTLTKAETEDTKIRYLGGGSYDVEIRAPDYKEAEKIMKESSEKLIKEIEKVDGEISYERIE